MTRSRRALLPSLWLCFALALSVVTAGAEQERSVRRFALIVSSNDGGRERVRLRFADSDARAVADVLTELGGVQRGDVLLLPGATAEALEASFARLRERLARAKEGPGRRELFVYYSGHSDETGLLLGDRRVAYRELRQWIDETRAEVRIAILDSCASGAVIRERGGVRRPPFLSDLSVEARGHAFLTASSADEAAQESDRVRGGFFTHYFLSGLRGAADVSRDGRITLAEAYHFSYNETLRRTEQSAGKAQHPAYDIQLAGTGDLVLTDLRSTASSLVLEEKIKGRLFIRNDVGQLMVELQKEPLYPVQLGLSPGEYEIALDADGQSYEAKVRLAQGETVRLGRSEFAMAELELADARGEPAWHDRRRPSALIDPDLGVKLGGYGGLAFRYANIAGSDTVMGGGEIALLFNHRFALGFAGFGGASDPPSNGLAFGYGGVLVRYHVLFDGSPFYFSLAALAGAGGYDDKDQRNILEDAADRDEDAVFVFEPMLSGHVNITPWLRLSADAGYRFVTDGNEYRGSEFDGPVFGVSAQIGLF